MSANAGHTVSASPMVMLQLIFNFIEYDRDPSLKTKYSIAFE